MEGLVDQRSMYLWLVNSTASLLTSRMALPNAPSMPSAVETGTNFGSVVILGDSFLHFVHVVYDPTNNNATFTSNTTEIPPSTGIPRVRSAASLMLPISAMTTSSSAAVLVGRAPSVVASGSAVTLSANANLSSPTFALGSAATTTSTAESVTSSGSSSSAGVLAATMPGTRSVSGILALVTM